MSSLHITVTKMKPKSGKPALPPVLRLLRFGFSSLGPFFPRYFARLAYHFWLTPQQFKLPELEQQALLTAEISTLVVNTVPVRLYRWGTGPLVLFVHGWSGRGSQATHFVNALTQSGFSVLSFDAPAHGATPGKHTNLMAISNVIVALHEKFGEFHAAITHSFGGMILPHALQRGVRVGRVANICPTASLDIILANFQRQLNIPHSIIALLRTELCKNFGEDLAQQVSTIRNVSELNIPALIIHDEDDEDIPWQSGKQVADAWPGSSFILTHALGHRRILRDSETVQRVVDFIRHS